VAPADGLWVEKSDLSAVMPAKAGIQYPVRQMVEPKPCLIAGGGDYWIIRFRG
jgi:hypothetical protein